MSQNITQTERKESLTKAEVVGTLYEMEGCRARARDISKVVGERHIERSLHRGG